MLRSILLLVIIFSLLKMEAQPFIVWPGDTNNDGVVNQLDIFPLGFGFSTSGPPRAGASTNWTPQSSTIWSGNLPATNVNYTYIDADGDGIIEFLDRDVVALNYDSLQVPNTGVPYLFPDTLVVPIPPEFSFSFSEDSVQAGDPLTISIHMDAQNTASPYVYAVAFSVIYNDELVNDTMTVARMPNSFLGTNANSIYIGAAPFSIQTGRQQIPMGESDFGKSATDGQNNTGDEEIANMSIVTVDDILEPEMETNFLHFEFRDIVVLDNQERVIGLVTSIADSIKVYDLNTIVNEAIDQNLDLFPNPVHDQLYITIPKSIGSGQLNIYSSNGYSVFSQIIQNRSTQEIDLSTFPNGYYLVKYQTNEVSFTNKFVVIH